MLRVVWPWLLAAMVPGVTYGQDGVPSPPAGTVPATMGTRPLAVSDILGQADEDQRLLDQARRLLEGPDPVTDLRPGLESISRSTDAQAHLVSSAQLQGVPVMRLESLARQWEFNRRRLERWQAMEQVRLAPYGDQAVRLAQRRALWAATRAQGILDGLPPALIRRVEVIIADIDAVEAELGEHLAAQDALKQRAATLSARIRAGSAFVAQAIAHVDHQLLELDAPPLWKGLALREPGQPTGAVDAADRGLAIETALAADYRAAGGVNQQALKIFHLVLIPVLAFLVVRTRRAHLTPSARAVPRALRRPVSTFVLLSMLAVLMFEPDAPLLVEQSVLLLALVPAVRLIPGSLSRRTGMWPYVAVVFYVLDQVGILVVGDAGLYRLFLLLLSVVGVGLTLWFSRHIRHLKESPAPGFVAWMRPVAIVVATVFAAAVLSNVLGNVSLAETLSSGIVDAGFMALVLYSAAAAVLGLAGVIAHDPTLAHSHVLTRYGRWLRKAGTRVLWCGVLLGWVFYSLSRFRLLRPVRDSTRAVWDWGLEVGEVSVHVGDLVTFAVAIVLAIQIARGMRLLLREELPRRASLPRGVGNSVASLTYYVILVLGLLFGLSAAGLKLGQLAFLFGALGVGVGFGLQNVVNNFVSGVVLMIERPIQPGDVIEVAGHSGTVRAIGLRATIIRSFEGSDVVVPNGALISGNLTNWTMFDRARRVEIAVGVAYGSDPAKVISLLETAASLTAGVAADPKPSAQFAGYGSSDLQFVLRAWTPDLDTWGNVKSDLLAQTLSALNQAGVIIPFPQVEVSLRPPVGPTGGLANGPVTSQA